MPSDLPLHHYRHLKRLADLRRCTVVEALPFLIESVAPSDENWLDPHWGETDETRRVELGDLDLGTVLAHIQGMPRNIRPVTDGPYLEGFEFFSDAPGLLGIRAEGVSILDFEKVTAREEAVFPLVRDLLPAMSLEQYRVYNTFTSQYLRLVREPMLFTMPRTGAPAIDAGCYVGYKALALAQFTDGHEVLAFELEAENFEVLERNAANNADLRVRPIRAALSDRRVEMRIQTRNEKTMAHSLSSFDTLHEKGTSLLGTGEANHERETVTTQLLDEFTGSMPALSAVHVSVNGHEPEVLGGAQETLKKSDIVRVSCPYKRDGRLVRDLAIEQFHRAGVEVFGISGAAVIAGARLGDYHAKPLESVAARG